MIAFCERLLTIDGTTHELEHPIKLALESGSNVIVLFKKDGQDTRMKGFRNLICISRQGKRLWVAELPTTENMDRYYAIASSQPLIAYSVCSYECEIDPTSGRVVRASFFK